MSKKANLPAPPDFRLAQAFDFTADDLSANRAGYMTQRQLMKINVSGRGAYNRMMQWLFKREPEDTENRMPEVAMICGRARLRHHVAPRRGSSMFGNRPFDEIYILGFERAMYDSA